MRFLLKGISLIFLFFISMQSLNAMEIAVAENKMVAKQFSKLPIELKQLILCKALDGELTDFQIKSKDAPFLLKRFFFILHIQNKNGLEYLLSKNNVKCYFKKLARKVADIYNKQLNIPESFFAKRFYNGEQSNEIKKLINDLLDYRFTFWALVAAQRIAIDQSSESLYLSFSQIKSLEGLENYDLSHLTSFILRFNRLRILPPTMGGLTNLKKLSLDGNQLETVPDCIGNLTNLEELSLDDNGLRILPPTMGGLTNLKKLSLDRNKLETVSDCIGNLTNLEELSLDDNRLRVLPPTMGGLTNLKKLSLEENRLKIVPDCIGNLTNLEELSLHDNRIRILPPTMGGLTNLKKLVLASNQLKSLPNIGGLAKLKHINLANNRFSAKEKQKIKVSSKCNKLRI